MPGEVEAQQKSTKSDVTSNVPIHKIIARGIVRIGFSTISLVNTKHSIPAHRRSVSTIRQISVESLTDIKPRR